MNLVEIHQLLALKAVELGDESYSLRFIFRWYSKNFHVPLPDVGDLPLEDVLQAYFESEYEGMEEGQREQVARELVMSPEEKKEKLLAKEARGASDEDFAKEAEKEASGGSKVAKNLAASITKLSKTIEQMPSQKEEESGEFKLEPETVFEFDDDDQESFL